MFPIASEKDSSIGNQGEIPKRAQIPLSSSSDDDEIDEMTRQLDEMMDEQLREIDDALQRQIDAQMDEQMDEISKQIDDEIGKAIDEQISQQIDAQIELGMSRAAEARRAYIESELAEQVENDMVRQLDVGDEGLNPGEMKHSDVELKIKQIIERYKASNPSYKYEL